MRSSVCWLVILCCLVLPVSASARSYELLGLEVEAQVGADAVVRISETHTVKFNGTFSGFYQVFDTSREIAIRDVVVSEGGMPYQRIPGDTPGEPGTFFVKESDDEVLVDWSFSATDEVREFTVSYTLHNAILKHNDVAEFYYQFVGTGWDLPRDRVRVVLTLPHGATTQQVAAWGYGPPHGTVTIESPTRIVWEVEKLPANTFLEGRVVFPNSLVPLGTRYTNENGLERILEDEERRLERERRAERRQAADSWAAALVFLVSGALVFYLGKRFAQRGRGYKDRYYKGLPGNYPPAELALLYRRSVDGRDFTATVLDLARRGFLRIEEVSDQGKSNDGSANYLLKKLPASPPDLAQLRSYETRILRLFADLGEKFTLDDLRVYVEKHPEKFAAFWKEWLDDVRKAAAEHGFFAEAENKRALAFLLPAVGLIIVAVAAASLEMFWTAGMAFFSGIAVIIMVVVSAARMSEYGYEQYTKWIAFRRYLKEFSRVDQVRLGALGLWEEYLPYAVTLGVADQMLNQLEIGFPSLQDGTYRFGTGWLIYHHWAGVHSVSHLTSGMERSINQSVTIPQGTGSGGGFSPGGGGGFGGGGGGAR